MFETEDQRMYNRDRVGDYTFQVLYEKAKEFAMVSSSPELNTILSQWNIPERVRDKLEKYYLLRWQTDYFKIFMKSGVIVHQGQEYQIIYHDCLPAHLDSTPEVMLSFRKLASLKYGYVLVKPAVPVSDK